MATARFTLALPDDPMDDISMRLIAKKAGHGLAPPKWPRHARTDQVPA
jgi:hypothetical protein